MGNENNYELMTLIMDVLSDKNTHHINELIRKLILMKNISAEEREKLIQTGNDKLIIRSFDQKVQIALTHLLVFDLIKADQRWSFNIDYSTSYCLAEKGIKFMDDNKSKSKFEIIGLFKKEMKQISESLIRKQ